MFDIIKKNVFKKIFLYYNIRKTNEGMPVMKILISLLAIPFKILIRLPRFIINAIRPFEQVYKKSNQYYTDYQAFMCTSDMPDFGLIYHRLNPIDKAEEYYQNVKCIC